MQLAWMWRFFVIAITGTTMLWLLSRTQAPRSAGANARLLRFLEGRGATVLGCGLWLVAALAVYFVYAGRLSTFSWNMIEFIIANHLQDAGGYALGATYPTAVWRPVGPTFIVLAIDAFARDPLTTYQLLSGAAMASLVGSTYLLNRMLFGQWLAHAGRRARLHHARGCRVPAQPCAFAIAPVLSHGREPDAARLGDCDFAGCVPAHRACNAGSGPLRSAGRSATCAAPRAMFMAAVFFLAIGILAVRRGRVLRSLASLAPFVVVLVGFNLWAGASAARDDLLSRKMIYQLYASQGWVDLFDAKLRAAAPTDDFELHGYVHAIQLYGTPQDNSESLTSAIARNPKAFAERIGNNVRQLADLTAKGKFLSFELLLILFALPLGFLFLKKPLRLLVFFAAGVFSVIGIFLIFHIDDRYVTVAVPAVLLLASLSAHGLNRLPMPARFGRNAFAASVLVVALLHLPAHFTALSHSFARERLDLSAFRQMGEDFRDAVRASPAERARMTVHLDVPMPPALKSIAPQLLFPYFARTSLAWAVPSDSYPRDRLFALPQCPATHAIVADPAAGSRPGEPGAVYVSQVGNLVVRRLTPAVPAAGTFAAKFCTAH